MIMMNIKSGRLLGCVLFGSLLFGCTHHHMIEASPANLQSSYVVPLSAGVILTADYCSYEFSMRRQGETHVFHLGETLCTNTKKLMGELFTTIEVLSLSGGIKDRKADVLVSPKLVDASVQVNRWRSEGVDALIIVEWTVTDRNGKVLLTKTVQGKAHTVGGPFSVDKTRNRAISLAIDEVFSESAKAFQQSIELRKVARAL